MEIFKICKCDRENLCVKHWQKISGKYLAKNLANVVEKCKFANVCEKLKLRKIVFGRSLWKAENRFAKTSVRGKIRAAPQNLQMLKQLLYKSPDF